MSAQSDVSNYVSQKREYYSQSFELPIDNINVNNGAKPEHNAAANKCGFFFEYEVFRLLCEKTGNKAEGYSGEQLEAAAYFHGSNRSITSCGEVITKAADYATTEFIKQVEEEAKEKVNWEIKVIADVLFKRGNFEKYIGNPAGDLQVIVNGKSIVLELKWQQGDGKQIAFFHRVSEDVLFGGLFKGYLKKNFATFWDHRFREDQWKTSIGVNAVSNFLLETYGNWKTAIKWLLAKGHAA